MGQRYTSKFSSYKSKIIFIPHTQTILERNSKKEKAWAGKIYGWY